MNDSHDRGEDERIARDQRAAPYGVCPVCGRPAESASLVDVGGDSYTGYLVCHDDQVCCPVSNMPLWGNPGDLDERVRRYRDLRDEDWDRPLERREDTPCSQPHPDAPPPPEASDRPGEGT
jgi:hypothetical protein